MYEQAKTIETIVDQAKQILIVQADNPDADSLGSALALEHILGDLGKVPLLYCAVDMPGYLRYMSGWDRVQKELPKHFDASIIVDASTMTLFEHLVQGGQQSQLATKPCIVLDHHQTVDDVIPFADVMINDHTRASAGELIYIVGQQLGWTISKIAQEFILSSILGDTQGLSNQLAGAQTYRIVADMVDAGVDRPALEELRRQFGKMPPAIFKYKAQLISHTHFSDDGKLAHVVVPQVEINQYSPLYNPGPLIQGDMLQTAGVQVAIVFKKYDSGIVTAAIRCNPVAPIAARLAEKFNGGGHTYAAGFKTNTKKPFEAFKKECLNAAHELIATLEEDTSDETIQHTF